MKSKHWILLFALFSTVVICAVYIDYIPPLTPQKRARLISELDIPRHAEIVFYRDNDAAPLSDFDFLVVLQLTDKQYSELTRQLNNDWKPLTKNVWSSLHISKKAFQLSHDTGYYWLSELERSSLGDITGLTISILSPEEKRVVVYAYSAG